MRASSILCPLRLPFALSGAAFLLAGLATPAREPVKVTWSPTPAQVAAWLQPAPGLPPEKPEVSLKVALPAGAGPVTVDLGEAEWSPVPFEGALALAGPAVSLGVRSRWRGIPFQEVLLRPVKPSDREGEVLLLSRARLEVSFEGGEFSEGAERAPVPPGDASAFVNPGDAHRSLSGPGRESAESSAPVGFRISVSRDGIYRLDQAYLLSHGFDPTGVDPQNLRLACQGVEIPIYVEGESDGHFDAADAILFYGQRLPIRERPTWNGGEFTETNIYWLQAGATPGARMGTLAAAPQGSPTPPATFVTTVRAEVDSTVDWVVYHLRPNGDVWFWNPLLSSGVPGAYTLGLPRSAGSPVTLTALLAGLSPGAHAIVPRLDGVSPTAGPNPATWSGVSLASFTWTFPAPASESPVLSLSLPADGDYVIPDSFETAYGRSFAPDSGALLLEAADAEGEFACPGHASAPWVFDVSPRDPATGIALPRRLTGVSYASGTATFHLSHDGSASRRSVALSSSPLLPDGMEAPSGVDLSSGALAADLLIVTHPDFVTADPASVWQRYLVRRQGQMQVLVVQIQDVYDNFSHGILDPAAIKTLLTTASASWATPPKYVLLIGDGSYDYENNEGDSTLKNWVPTMMIEDLSDSSYLGRYPSDAWFADSDGDGYPDIPVGRIPARNLAELEGVLGKVLTYETSALSGTWYKTALLVADKWTHPWEQEFEVYSDLLASAFVTSPYAAQKIYYGRAPYNGVDPAGCALAIRTAFPGCALLNFTGHGGFRSWGYDASNLFFSADKLRSGGTKSDVDLLPYASAFPFVLNGTCYTSAFDEVGFTALAEDLLKRAGKGAIGSCGQTTIGYVSEEETFTTAAFNQLFGPPKARTVGDVVEAGRFALPSSSSRAVFASALLSDPTLALRLPAPPPPPALTATGQNAAVSLSWTAPSPAPSKYDVYRSGDGGNSWSLANATPIPHPTLSYLDSGLTNLKAYAYYVTAIDAGGFVGPPSPLASATPSNPDPPAAPTGLHAWDAEPGASLGVAWTPNAEPDLSGYTLYWGESSGAHTWSRSLPKGVSSTVVEGLSAGVTYYFTVTAANTSGKTSAPSGEATGIPSGLRLAVRPPGMIADLRVTRQGQDLRLSWTKPAADVGGSPVEVSKFQVFRAFGPFDWSLEGLSPEVELPALAGQSAYTWDDSGAAGLPGPLSYLVVALSPTGVRSPASVAPPSPVLDLRVARTAAGDTLLSFSPVSTDILGRPASIARYQLYGFHPMTASSDHVSPPAPVLSDSIASPLPSCAGGTAVYCYSGSPVPLLFTVVAVDRRGNTSLY